MNVTAIAISIVAFSAILAAGACSSSDNKGSASSSSSSSSGSITGSTSSGGTSGAPGNVALTGYATAICTRLTKCSPDQANVRWATQAECIADQLKQSSEGLSALPGASFTQTQADACAAKIAASPCAIGLEGIQECQLKGTLPNDLGCYDGSQCSSGRCKRLGTNDECGRCATLGKEGADCIDDVDCDFGLECFGDGSSIKCKARIAKGGACSKDTVDCAFGLQCVGGTCKEPIEENGACTSDSDQCRKPLTCINNACVYATHKVVAIGEACGADVLCRQSSCRGAKCIAYATRGQGCSSLETDTKADCDDANTCSQGICAENTFPSCR